MSVGLASGWYWCRLFQLDGASTCGAPADFLVLCCGLLCHLLGGLGRFIPCRIGANHCRLRALVWEREGHGLTCGPREVAEVGFLDVFRSLLGILLTLVLS